MNRLKLTLAVLALALTASTAQAQLIRVGGPPSTAGVQLITPGIRNADQLIIPVYRQGSNFPAGQIAGYGPCSVIQGTSGTRSLTAASGFNYPAIIQTQGLGTTQSEWQGTSVGATTACLMPRIADVTVEGYSTDYTQAGDVYRGRPDALPSHHAGDQGDPDLYWGAIIGGNAADISHANFFYIPGTALYVTRNGTIQNGTSLTFDGILPNIDHVKIQRVFRGLDYMATDCNIDCVEIWSFRDYGVRIGSNSAGNCHGGRIHCYGGGYASEPAGTGGAAIWVDGQSNQLHDLYGENAPIGMLVSGSKNNIDRFQSIVCATANLKVTGTYNTITGLDINADAIGADIENQFNTLRGGTITVNGSGVGIKIANGTGTRIDNVGIGNTGSSSTAIAVTGALNHAYIVCDIGGASGVKGIDFSNGGSIGTQNTVIITTSGGMTAAATLPSGWQNTTAKHTTNQVWIGGKQYWPSADEF